MRHVFLCQTLAVASVLALVPSPAVGQLLPDCTIDFDVACPDVATVCGADFESNHSCITIAQPSCYSSGTKSFCVSVNNPLTIQLSDNMTSLDVFFAQQGLGSIGEMRFFDAPVGGNEVGLPLTPNGDCLVFMPPMQLVSFDAPVRRVEVTVTAGQVWIDDFHVNPLVPNCGGVNDCSGNGECIGQDLCVCDEGWSGDECSMNCTPCLYGDITSATLCVPTCTGAGTDIDFDDVLCALNGFALATDCPCADIAGAVDTACIPDGVINFDDILGVLDAFAGNSTCPDPCI